MRKGWQTKRLGEVCEVEKTQGVHRGLPYVGLEEIESNTGRFVGSREPRPVKSATFRFSREHVLYGRLRPYLNKAIAPDFEGHCSTEVFPIKPAPELSRQYLLYWLLADETRERINATCTGARMPRADMNEVLDFGFPLPPHGEQHRIVRLLDEAFAGLATAKANAERNLQNARFLFESHLQSVYTERGKRWEKKRLGEIADFKNGLNFTRQSKGQTLRIVGVGDFQDNDEVPVGELQSVTVDGRVPDDYLIRMDDILTVRSNGSKDLVGRCMLVPEVADMISYSGFVIRIRFDKRAINPRFLLRFLKASTTRKKLTRDGGGANISNINQAKLSELPMLVPPLSLQEAIAVQLDALSQETRRLESVYEQKLQALASLKKSLLHQAFTGAL
jgi:type I restriction enzyme S subunit